MTKKKKSSRQKRTLIGAVCIAAVIMAGSTFAWFTSQDEVTNRLSANADYNVSIVESFTPPENWIPGQVVDKDVYAVNTGNIAAFVQEEVSGVMTVTTEVPTATFNASTCLQLTKAERYVMEAGAFLVYKPDGSSATLGKQIIKMVPNGTDLDSYTGNATSFTPDKTGLYVFRRAIDVDSTNKTEMFSYEGYYYDGGNFYKISNLTVTPDTVNDLAGDGINTDGILSAASAGYYIEETNVLTPKLTYDATNNRLVATVNTGSTGASYADLTTAATAYDKALEDYQLALAAFAAATSENSTADADVMAKKNAMDTAYNELQDAIDDVHAKTDAKAAADALVADLTDQQSALATQIGNETSGLTKDKADKLAAKTAADAAVTGSGTTAEVITQLNADIDAKAPNGHNHTTATYSDLNGLFGTDYAHYNYYQLIVAQKKAQEEYEAADAALTVATTQKATVDAALATATTAAATANTDLTTAQTTKDTKQTAYDAAVTEYNAAVTAAGAGGTSGNLAAAQTTLSNAAQTLANAESTYKALSDTLNSNTALKININLSDAVTTAGGVAGKWQHLPVANDADKAVFYYTSILEGSETSAKLIESITLDESVTADMYKSFDFDLNVALKSAQITYDTDDVTIKTDSVNGANGELDANATLSNAKDINTAITWAAKS